MERVLWGERKESVYNTLYFGEVKRVGFFFIVSFFYFLFFLKRIYLKRGWVRFMLICCAIYLRKVFCVLRVSLSFAVTQYFGLTRV